MALNMCCLKFRNCMSCVASQNQKSASFLSPKVHSAKSISDLPSPAQGAHSLPPQQGQQVKHWGISRTKIDSLWTVYQHSWNIISPWPLAFWLYTVCVYVYVCIYIYAYIYIILYIYIHRIPFLDKTKSVTQTLSRDIVYDMVTYHLLKLFSWLDQACLL